MEYHQKGNANFAWVEHMVSKLSMNGKAAIILTCKWLFISRGTRRGNQKKI